MPRPEPGVGSPPQLAGGRAILSGCDLPQQVGALPGLLPLTLIPPLQVGCGDPEPSPPVSANLPPSVVSKTQGKGLKTALTNEFITNGKSDFPCRGFISKAVVSHS